MFLPKHSHTADDSHGRSSAVALSPRKPQRITSKSQVETVEPTTQSLLATTGLPSPQTETESPMAMHATIDIPAVRPDYLDADPVIPPINAYGTFDPSLLSPSSRLRRTPSGQSSVSAESSHQPLLPSQAPQDYRRRSRVSGDLMPFADILTNISTWFRRPEAIPSNSTVRIPLLWMYISADKLTGGNWAKNVTEESRYQLQIPPSNSCQRGELAFGDSSLLERVVQRARRSGSCTRN